MKNNTKNLAGLMLVTFLVSLNTAFALDVKDTKGKAYTYRESKVQENERVSLPKALQGQIDKTALNNIELSSLLANGVKAKKGFTAKINSINSLGNSSITIDCDALQNGLLSCVQKSGSDFNKSAISATVLSKEYSVRSVSAHGGLIGLAVQTSTSDSGTSTIKNISEIFTNIKVVGNPYELDIIYSNPYFDNTIKYDIWIDLNHKYKQTKCREPKSENSGNIPQVGNYKLLFCSQIFHEPDLSTLTERGKNHMNRLKDSDNTKLDRVLTSDQPDLSPFFSSGNNPEYISFKPFYYFSEHGLILPAEFFGKNYLPQKYQQAIFLNPLNWGPILSPQFSDGKSTTSVEFKLK